MLQLPTGNAVIVGCVRAEGFDGILMIFPLTHPTTLQIIGNWELGIGNWELDIGHWLVSMTNK
ncbi:hypothetical protein QUB68_17935 [Microcoleus sp. A006_D1]